MVIKNIEKMHRSTIDIIKSICQKPLFGTRVIPRDATVDPALFSEDNYPVYCLKCSYCLRGLLDGKCPECGTTFARGQLLVRIYVTEWSDVLWRFSAARKWYWWLITLAYVIPIITGLGLYCVMYFVKFDLSNFTPTGVGDIAMTVSFIIVAEIIACPLFLITSLIIFIKSYPRDSWKRRQAVIKAIRVS